jgi:hypothetical protein
LLSLGLGESVLFAFALKGQIEYDAAIVFSIVGVVFALMFSDAVDSSGARIHLNISRPGGLYGFLYCLFYGVGMLFFVNRIDAPKQHLVAIALLVLIGYVGWWQGIRLVSFIWGRQSLRLPRFQPRESTALYLLCWVGFVCVLIGYAWRMSLGQFYTHAGSFEAEAGVANSLYENVTFPFEFPTIILLALLSADKVVAKKAAYSLYFFASVFGLIHLLASEFRLIIGVVIFAVGGLQFSRGFIIRWKHLAICGLLAMAALLLIQGGRLVVASFAGSELSIEEAARVTFEGLFAGSSERSEVASSTIERATDPLVFVSNLIDQVESGAPYVGTDVMIEQLRSLMPRALWKDKPILVPPQIMIKRHFGLPLVDDSPGPLISYYAAAGAWGVFFGLLLFGVLIGWLTYRTASHPTVFNWMLLIWIWGAVAIVEYDQATYIMLGIRHCLVAYAFYKIIYMACRDQRHKTPCAFPAVA